MLVVEPEQLPVILPPLCEPLRTLSSHSSRVMPSSMECFIVTCSTPAGAEVLASNEASVSWINAFVKIARPGEHSPHHPGDLVR